MILCQKFIVIEMHFDLNIISENMRHVYQTIQCTRTAKALFIRLCAKFSDRTTSSVLFEWSYAKNSSPLRCILIIKKSVKTCGMFIRRYSARELPRHYLFVYVQSLVIAPPHLFCLIDIMPKIHRHWDAYLFKYHQWKHANIYQTIQCTRTAKAWLNLIVCKV